MNFLKKEMVVFRQYSCFGRGVENILIVLSICDYQESIDIQIKRKR